MSRIGKKPINIITGSNIKIESGTVTVSGPKGELSLKIPAGVEVKIENNQVLVASEQSNMHGLIRSLINNMVTGVTTGWTKTLELSGTGFRSAVEGSNLNLALGFSHPVVVKAPAGITFEVNENKITVRGIDKTLVGEIAAQIRKLRPADPYKAKGFKYEGEIVRRKAGKAAKAAGAK
jgi:large subunit ribosomal protein L6